MTHAPHKSNIDSNGTVYMIIMNGSNMLGGSEVLSATDGEQISEVLFVTGTDGILLESGGSEVRSTTNEQKDNLNYIIICQTSEKCSWE